MEIGQVYYDSSAQWVLSLVLASMILGIALDISTKDFKAVFKMPRAVIAGVSAQFFILPGVTFLLTMMLSLPAGIELGMILVAACPGGAVSNFVTHLSRGNTALSITLTATASALAVVLLPFNFVFWAQFNPEAQGLLKEIAVDTGSLVSTLILVLALPLALGMFIKSKYSNLAGKLHRFLKSFSILAFMLFILIAVSKNFDAFTSHFQILFLVVLLHNTIAYMVGFITAKANKLDVPSSKAVTIEVGMQNSSLAVAIVFAQFGAEPGMALIAAFWGTWHLVSGMGIALLFRQWGRDTIPKAEAIIK